MIKENKKQTTTPTREAAKKAQPKQPAIETNVAKQKLAQAISEYASLETVGNRLKFIQEHLDPEHVGKGSLINQLAYIFPKTAAYDRDQLTTALQQSNSQLFNGNDFAIQIDKDISTGNYQFVRSFHLLGRHDEKDLFKVILQWSLLTDQLHVVRYSSDREIAEQLDRLNRYIDGASNHGTNIDDLNQQLAKFQGELDLLNDLKSNDKAKIKEARRYQDEFLKGRTLVQSLHDQGAYESVDSIKARAFSKAPINAVPDDNFDDFIEELRQLPENQVKDGGMFSRERPRNRHETIEALFNNELVTDPVITQAQTAIKNINQELEDAKTKQAQAAQAESSAIEMVKQKQTALIKQVEADLQKSLDQLADSKAINKIKVEVKY